MYILGVIFLLSFLVESLVEYLFAPFFDRTPLLQPHKWVLMYVSAAVGVFGCFFYGFDLLYLLGGYLDINGAYMQQATWLGELLTGFAVGRGSNYVHDLVTKFFVKSGER